MSPRALRVVLVEDNEVYRSSLELLLDMQPDLDVVAAVSSGALAAASAVAAQADVVLMDYRLPGLDGAAATRAVTETSQAAVVCLTAEASEEERDAVVRAGAVALVEKGGAIEALVETIRRAASGTGGVPGATTS